MKEVCSLCGVTLSCDWKCACQLIVGPPLGGSQAGSDAYHNAILFYKFKMQNYTVHIHLLSVL